MRCLKICLLFSVSQKSAEQSGVVTATGGNHHPNHPNGNESLNLSCGSILSNVSHISSILLKDIIKTVMDETDDPEVKSMIDEEFKNLEHEEKEKEKCKLELKRLEAKEKASVLWKKMKAS